MYQEMTFRYASITNSKVQVLELPYQGDDITMVFILPYLNTPLAQVEQQLTAEKLESWFRALKEVSLSVHLPRFKIESSFSLKEKLQEMGLRDLFSPERASLPGQLGCALVGSNDYFDEFTKKKNYNAVPLIYGPELPPPDTITCIVGKRLSILVQITFLQ